MASVLIGGENYGVGLAYLQEAARRRAEAQQQLEFEAQLQQQARSEALQRAQLGQQRQQADAERVRWAMEREDKRLMREDALNARAEAMKQFDMRFAQDETRLGFDRDKERRRTAQDDVRLGLDMEKDKRAAEIGTANLELLKKKAQREDAESEARIAGEKAKQAETEANHKANANNKNEDDVKRAGEDAFNREIAMWKVERKRYEDMLQSAGNTTYDAAKQNAALVDMDKNALIRAEQKQREAEDAARKSRGLKNPWMEQKQGWMFKYDQDTRPALPKTAEIGPEVWNELTKGVSEYRQKDTDRKERLTKVQEADVAARERALELAAAKASVTGEDDVINARMRERLAAKALSDAQNAIVKNPTAINNAKIALETAKKELDAATTKWMGNRAEIGTTKGSAYQFNEPRPPQGEPGAMATLKNGMKVPIASSVEDAVAKGVKSGGYYVDAATGKTFKVQ